MQPATSPPFTRSRFLTGGYHLSAHTLLVTLGGFFGEAAELLEMIDLSLHQNPNTLKLSDASDGDTPRMMPFIGKLAAPTFERLVLEVSRSAYRDLDCAALDAFCPSHDFRACKVSWQSVAHAGQFRDAVGGVGRKEGIAAQGPESERPRRVGVPGFRLKIRSVPIHVLVVFSTLDESLVHKSETHQHAAPFLLRVAPGQTWFSAARSKLTRQNPPSRRRTARWTLGATDPPDDVKYPTLLWDYSPISRSQLHQVIDKIYKIREFPQLHLQVLCCVCRVVPRLYVISRALDSHRYEPDDWKRTETIVERRPGKPNYSALSAQRPLIVSHGHARCDPGSVEFYNSQLARIVEDGSGIYIILATGKTSAAVVDVVANQEGVDEQWALTHNSKFEAAKDQAYHFSQKIEQQQQPKKYGRSARFW
ncbi:hypothetical protein K438DRAFT_1969915 [Mycena galopus ATCC 62051]|nr:hypothetical protein K438DRAFT_1969915 [Mycena galopus ATCC 62051]